MERIKSDQQSYCRTDIFSSWCCLVSILHGGMQMTRKHELEELFGTHMVNAIKRYLYNKLSPGHFLTAIISNDLKEAVSHADNNNKRLIPEYVEYFHTYCPMNCWGSAHKMETWLNTKEENISIVGEE